MTGSEKVVEVVAVVVVAMMMEIDRELLPPGGTQGLCWLVGFSDGSRATNL